MNYAFDPTEGIIIISSELKGPSGSVILRLALDTGATRTLINAAMLVSIGYDTSFSQEHIQVTTGSGVEYASVVTLSKFKALNIEMTDFPILCHTLPPSAGVDGLLGLDFFREQVLILDFKNGKIIVD